MHARTPRQIPRVSASNSMPPSSLLLLALLGFYCFSLLPPPVAAVIEMDPPTIQTQPTAIAGELIVTITSTQPHTYVYYTLDNSTPDDSSDRFAEGAELTLGTPGHYILKAVAYSKFSPSGVVLKPSAIVVAEYDVKPTALLPPTASPPAKVELLRGTLTVTLSTVANTSASHGVGILFILTHFPNWLTFGFSGALPPAPTNVSWQLYDTRGIVLNNPGTYILRARVFDSSVSPNEYSPRATFVYRLRQSLMYDVSTECCDDPQQPVVGQMFTVWISNMVRGSSLFLTTSAKGCETGRHILDDTDKVRVFMRQVAFPFVTFTEAQSKVFVCLNESNSERYVMVPRRFSTEWPNTSVGDSFSIIAGSGDIVAVARAKPTSPPPAIGGMWIHSEEMARRNYGSSGSGMVWVVFFLGVAMMLFTRMCIGRGLNPTHASETGRLARLETQGNNEDWRELVAR